MSNSNGSLLIEAIARNSAAVLSLPSAGMTRNHKTRFLAETAEGFWVESVGEEDLPLVASLIAEKAPVSIAFKAGPSMVIFTTLVRAQQEHFKVNAATSVRALLIGYPTDFSQQQRRQAYRVALPIDHQIGLKLWRIPEQANLRDRPLASQELFATLDDLSVSGLGVQCRPGRDGEPPRAIVQERLRIILSWGKQELMTEGRVMHKRALDSGLVVLGIEFKKLEKDYEGRQTMSRLTELMGDMQREEIKRRRVEIAA